MPSVDPGSTLRVGLKEQFETGLYSDLTIKDSTGHEYAVHRSIVCAQSPVFAKACNPKHGFKEAKISVIDLEHQDPDAVKAMLEFMYTGSYNIADDENAMMKIARIFALGDMYCVSELKEAAAVQLNALSSIFWGTTDFADAVRVIYESIPSSIHACASRQKAVSDIAEHYIVLLDKPEFQTLLKDFSTLGMDILRVMASRKAIPLKKYTCPGNYRISPHTVMLGPELKNGQAYFYCGTCNDTTSCSSVKPIKDD